MDVKWRPIGIRPGERHQLSICARGGGEGEDKGRRMGGGREGGEGKGGMRKEEEEEGVRERAAGRAGVRTRKRGSLSKRCSAKVASKGRGDSLRSILNTTAIQPRARVEDLDPVFKM